MIRRALAESMKPASARVAFAAAVLAGAAVLFAFVHRGAHHTGWQIDEAYKLSETYALHHLLRGEIHHPDWFRTRIDRTNPPFGKYVFGLAMLAAGERLPERSTLTQADSPLSEAAPNFSDAVSAPFLPLRTPARWVSMLATAFIASVIAYLAARVQGVLAAIIAVLLFEMHWVTEVFGANAIFDPLLTSLVMLTGLLLFEAWRVPERMFVLAPFLGAIAAAAFQTRLNGAIAIAGCAALLLHRSKRAVLAFAVTIATFAIVAIAINPYYWSTAPDDPSIPANVRAPHSLVPRVISRVDNQVRELAAILSLFDTGGVRLPLWASDSSTRARTPWNIAAKTRYLSRAIAGDFIGIAMVIGVVCASFVRHRDARFLAAWCASIVLGTCVWLPLPWSRYLFVIVPPLALLGGIGASAAIARLASRRLAAKPS